MATPKPTPDNIAFSLLSRSHSPTTASNLYVEKVKQRPLLLHPTATISKSDDRSRRRITRLRKKEHFLRKQKPRPLSAKEKRSLGVYEIPKEEQKYEIYEKLHELWVEYMQDILGLQAKEKEGGKKQINVINVAGHGSLLATADFHGAVVEVVRSKCAGRVGTKGIVVRDTKFTFVVITTGNELKTIPKDNNVFRFEVPLPSVGDGFLQTPDENATPKPLVFELYGEQFQYRPADRANKKFKWQRLENL